MLVSAALIGTTGPARADSFACYGDGTCVFGLTGAVTATIFRSHDANGDWLNLGTNPSRVAGRTPISRVKSIVVRTGSDPQIVEDRANQTVVIDLSGGPFAGAVPEIPFAIALGSGDADAVVVRGGAGSDWMRAGSRGINLNNDGDVEISLAGVERLTLQGNNGTDTLSAAGAAGTGSAYAQPITIQGGAGNDTITGGAGQDSLDGSAGNDTIYARDSKRDRVYGNTGTDRARVDPSDVLNSIERRI